MQLSNIFHKTAKIMLITLVFSSVMNHAREWGQVMHLNDFAQKGETVRQTYDRIIAENECVVFKFYITGCGPCKALAPEFIAQAQQNKTILFVEINANEYGALSEQLAIRSAPTLIFYKNHLQMSRWTGGDKQRLRTDVTRLLQ